MQEQGQYREYAYALDGGIFDVLKNEEANTYLHGQIQSGKSLEESCKMLVEEARRKWKGGLPLDVRIDDTSVVTLTFNYDDALLINISKKYHDQYFALHFTCGLI